METQLGRRIRALRLSRNLTQGQLAERAGLNEKYIGVLEREGKDLAVSTLVSIARALDVPVGELFAEPTRGDKDAAKHLFRQIVESGDADKVRRLRAVLENFR